MLSSTAVELALDAAPTIDHGHLYVTVSPERFETTIEALIGAGFDFVQRPRERYSYSDQSWHLQAELVQSGIGVHVRALA